MLCGNSGTGWFSGCIVSRIHVLYFAALRDQAGRSEEWLDCQPGDTPSAVFDRLAASRQLQLAPAQLRVAINDRFAEWTTHLNAGDRLAFIPPMSGG